MMHATRASVVHLGMEAAMRAETAVVETVVEAVVEKD